MRVAPKLRERFLAQRIVSVKKSLDAIPQEVSEVREQRGELHFGRVGLRATVNEQRRLKVQDTYVPLRD